VHAVENTDGQESGAIGRVAGEFPFNISNHKKLK